MVRIIFLFLLPFLATISCQKGNKVSDYKLSLDLLIKMNDSIHVYYKSDGTIDFNEKESVWVKIKGQNRNQKVVVQFPKQVIPNQIRIDFSNSLDQKEVVLNKVEFSYLKNTFVAKGKEIYKYFRIDQSNTVLDEKSGALTRKAQQPNGPSLYPNGYYLAVKLEELKFKK